RPPPSHSPLQNLRRPCDTATLRARPTPSPSLPARGRVSDRGRGTLPSQPPVGTSPLAGEDGRGVAAHSAPSRSASPSPSHLFSRSPPPSPRPTTPPSPPSSTPSPPATSATAKPPPPPSPPPAI